MKVLIVDDHEYKIQSLSEVLRASCPRVEVDTARAFQPAKRKLLVGMYDLILLDMTLPNFQRTDGTLNGIRRIYGGQEILEEMRFAEINCPVVIVTQFEWIGEGDEREDFISLISRLKREYSEYVLGGVHYSAAKSEWAERLRELLRTTNLLS